MKYNIYNPPKCKINEFAGVRIGKDCFPWSYDINVQTNYQGNHTYVEFNYGRGCIVDWSDTILAFSILVLVGGTIIVNMIKGYKERKLWEKIQ